MDGYRVNQELTSAAQTITADNHQGPACDLGLQLRHGHSLLFHKPRSVCAGDSEFWLGYPRNISIVGSRGQDFTSKLLGQDIRIRYVAQTRPRHKACLERTCPKFSEKSKAPTICWLPDCSRHLVDWLPTLDCTR